jgi:hypothetical protein
VFYNDEPVFTDLPVSDWSLSWDLESEIKSTGNLTAAYTSDGGGVAVPARVPRCPRPVRAASERPRRGVRGSVFTETLQLGRFRINQSAGAVDSYFQFLGKTLTAGSLVKLHHRRSAVVRETRRVPLARTAQMTDSTWDEVQRITALPVNPNLTDAPTPPG